MKRRVLLILIGMSLALATSHAQTPAPALNDFAGAWKAEFHKQTWLVLTLENAKNAFTGTLTHSTEISADDEGDITQVGDEMSTDKIVRTEVQDATLHITTRDEDGVEDNYNFVLTGKDTAELQPIVSGGSNAPKAFRLKRTPPPQK